MASPFDNMAAESIRALMERETGISFREFRESFLIDRARVRMRTLGLNNLIEYASFLQGHLGVNERGEIDGLISEMTVNETSFFRDPGQFDFLKAKVLPGLESRPLIRMLSAACATGEEPFSIAICAAEYFGAEFNAGQVEILACDIDHDAIDACRKGEYADGSRRLVGVSPPQLMRYFSKHGKTYCVDGAIRRWVTFKYLNLITDDIPGRFDVIFCKNVLYYFSDTHKQNALEKLYRALNPGGYMFFGMTEVVDSKLRGEFPDMTLLENMVFQKRGAADA